MREKGHEMFQQVLGGVMAILAVGITAAGAGSLIELRRMTTIIASEALEI